MNDELFEALTRYHEQFVRPEFDRVFGGQERLEKRVDALTNAVEGLYVRMERLESEVAALRVGMTRS